MHTSSQNENQQLSCGGSCSSVAAAKLSSMLAMSVDTLESSRVQEGMQTSSQRTADNAPTEAFAIRS
jgi:hypothetical protein